MRKGGNTYIYERKVCLMRLDREFEEERGLITLGKTAEMR